MTILKIGRRRTARVCLAACLLVLHACSGGTAPKEAGVPDPVAYIQQAYAAEIAGSGAGASEAGEASTADTSDDASRGSRERSARDAVIETYGLKAIHATPRLAALFDEDAKFARGEIGRLDFNYFTGSQDRELSEVAVSGADVAGSADRRIVSAQFKNFGRPIRIDFEFQRIGDGWFIDDVSSPGFQGADDPPAWRLSKVLKPDAT
jgi:hypothetical protein